MEHATKNLRVAGHYPAELALVECVLYHELVHPAAWQTALNDAAILKIATWSNKGLRYTKATILFNEAEFTVIRKHSKYYDTTETEVIEITPHEDYLPGDEFAEPIYGYDDSYYDDMDEDDDDEEREWDDEWAYHNGTGSKII